jgi:hypothetical protein
MRRGNTATDYRTSRWTRHHGAITGVEAAVHRADTTINAAEAADGIVITGQPRRVRPFS